MPPSFLTQYQQMKFFTAVTDPHFHFKQVLHFLHPSERPECVQLGVNHISKYNLCVIMKY